MSDVGTFVLRFACRNCPRPIYWVDSIGWLHGALPQYAHEPITCEIAHPSICKHHIDAPCPLEASRGLDMT